MNTMLKKGDGVSINARKGDDKQFGRFREMAPLCTSSMVKAIAKSVLLCLLGRPFEDQA